MIQDHLTEIEISQIQAFCANEQMFDAVHKAVLAVVYYTGALKKGEKFQAKNQAFDLISTAYSKGDDISNETLGAGLRGLFEGVDSVEQGFARLKSIKNKKSEPVPSDYNEAL